MTFIVVSYLYPPSISPRAFRWSSIAAEWGRMGYEVDVLCAEGPDGVATRRTEGVTVRVAAGAMDRWRAHVKRGLMQESPPASGAALERAGRTVRLARRAWRSVYWPDYACLWFGTALRMARRLLSDRCYDAMFTVSIPFTSHLVGLWLKRTNPRLPWIVDVGDPFSFSDGVPQNNTHLYGRLNRMAEGWVLRRADAVAVTTSQTRVEYADLFPGIGSKLSVIPPVYAPLDHAALGPGHVFPRDDKLRLVFLGTLYRDIRSPRFLLDLFSRLLQSRVQDRLELHFFGDVNDAGDVFQPHARLLGQKIFLHGVVDRGRALTAMAGAHILVNIGNNTAYQLPSKVVEYVYYGKPILNVVRAADDSSVAFLAGYPAAYTVLEGSLDGAGVEALIRFVEHPPAIPAEALRRWRDPFTVESVAASYLGLIPRARCESSMS